MRKLATAALAKVLGASVTQIKAGAGHRLDLGSERARSASKPKQKGGGLHPPPFGMVWTLEADRARSDPKYRRFLAPA